MKRPSIRGQGSQRGVALVVALLLLMLLMIHSLSSFTASNTQLRNVGAQQARQEAQAAAQQVIAGVIGASAFVTAPVASPVDVDVDGDGRDDYRVALTVSCIRAQPVRSIVVSSTASADDSACLAATTAGGDIPCADTEWNVRAVAAGVGGALQSGASTEINQGVAVRLSSADAARSCPGAIPAGAFVDVPPVLTRARRKTYWYQRPGL